MNTKRIIFWACFLVLLGLIVWGLVAAMGKPQAGSLPKVGDPAPVTAADHIRGPSDAPVTFIEYSDFQCPACEAYYPVIEHILASSTVPIRFVYRHFPLPQHANAALSARASEAAGLQGKFWEMYALLFANHTEWTELADPHAVFAGYAERIGLNAARFKTDIDGPVAKAAVQASLDEATRMGLGWTPTFFLNGTLIQPQSYDQLAADIQAAAR